MANKNQVVKKSFELPTSFLTSFVKNSVEKTAENPGFPKLRFPPIWTWLRRWSPKHGNSRSRNDAFKTLKLGKGWEKDGKIDGKHGKKCWKS